MGSSLSDQFNLAVDTSGRVGSVCIGKDSEVLKEHFFSGMMRHAAELFPTLLDLLEDFNIEIHNIDNIFVTAGPGSFTGLRIGITLAKMMALAGEVKIVSISTLDVIAENAITKIEKENLDITRISPIIDAKRKQFFLSTYEKTSEDSNIWQKTTNDTLMDVETFRDKFDIGEKPIWLLGEGLKYYKDKFASDGIKFFDESLWSAKAANLYKLGYEKALKGEYETPSSFVPHYNRLSDAEEAWQAKFA